MRLIGKTFEGICWKPSVDKRPTVLPRLRHSSINWKSGVERAEDCFNWESVGFWKRSSGSHVSWKSGSKQVMESHALICDHLRLMHSTDNAIKRLLSRKQWQCFEMERVSAKVNSFLILEANDKIRDDKYYGCNWNYSFPDVHAELTFISHLLFLIP